MNPAEKIQDKTNQFTEEIKQRVKREFTMWMFTKSDGLVRGMLYIVFFLSSLVFFFLLSFFLFIFKGITDFHGEITYGATLVAFVVVVIISIILSFIIKVFINRKYIQFKKETMEELGGSSEVV